jgi:hypothetical protein
MDLTSGSFLGRLAPSLEPHSTASHKQRSLTSAHRRRVTWLELNPKFFVGFSVSRSSCRAPDYIRSRSHLRDSASRLRPWREGLGGRKGESTSRVSRPRGNSERRYRHASDWINAQMSCASVYLSWTIYVIITDASAGAQRGRCFKGERRSGLWPVRPQG